MRRRHALYLLVLLFVAGATLAATLPASVVLRAAEWPAGLTHGAIEGPWYRARITQLHWQRYPLGALEYRVTGLLPLTLDVRGSGPDTALTGRVQRTADGFVVERLDGLLDARWLSSALGLPAMTLSGQIAIDQLALAWPDPKPSGTITVRALALQSPVQFQLGSFELQCDGMGAGQLRDLADGPLQVVGKVSFAADSYRLEADLIPTRAEPGLADALMLIGEARIDGGRRLVVEGRISPSLDQPR